MYPHAVDDMLEDSEHEKTHRSQDNRQRRRRTSSDEVPHAEGDAHNGGGEIQECQAHDTHTHSRLLYVDSFN